MSILPRAPPLPTGKKFHVYLSYLWGDGQALPVALKLVLQLSARGIRVFLDLDDLEDINALEAYIDASAVCVCLVSPDYFASKNCRRDVSAMLSTSKPIVLLDAHSKPHELDDSAIRAACPAEFAALLDGRPIHKPKWIKAEREFMLKRLLDEVLQACGQARRLTVLPRVALPKPVVLFASPSNPGAAAVVEEMRAALQPTSAPLTLAAERAGGRMLLYLNKETFAGAAGAALAAEVGDTLGSGGPPLMLVHECDPAKGGVPLGDFFQSTPPALLEKGLFKRAVVQLKGGDERAVGVRLGLQALGARDGAWLVVVTARKVRGAWRGAVKRVMGTR